MTGASRIVETLIIVIALATFVTTHNNRRRTAMTANGASSMIATLIIVFALAFFVKKVMYDFALSFRSSGMFVDTIVKSKLF